MKILFYTSECITYWDYLSKLKRYSTVWYNHQCYQNSRRHLSHTLFLQRYQKSKISGFLMSFMNVIMN